MSQLKRVLLLFVVDIVIPFNLFEETGLQRDIRNGLFRSNISGVATGH